ncbi:spatacsin [Protopterus annectens]|uniref:spatacsin n=1 Tax=Protopterus annectens TaxID=7888 RepID=UPI001CF972E6|nr:spatacsin [Protopterus annectens]
MDCTGPRGLHVLLPTEKYSFDNVGELRRAWLSKESGILAALTATDGGLCLSDLSVGREKKLRIQAVDTSIFTDFICEKTGSTVSSENHRLVALTSSNELYLYQLQFHDGDFSVNTSFHCKEHTLLELVRDENLCLSPPLSLKLLSFENNRLLLLLNNFILLRLTFFEKDAGITAQDCISLGLPPQTLEKITSGQITKEILFLFDVRGFIYIFDAIDGKQVAFVDPAFYRLREIEPDGGVCGLSSFSVLIVSSGLDAVVLVNHVNFAICINLNEYFRRNPDHLLCNKFSEKLPLTRLKDIDEDDPVSTSHLTGLSFQTNRSWDSHLTSLYWKTKACTTTVFIPEISSPWYMHLPRVELNEGWLSSRCRGASAISQESTCDFSRYIKKRNRHSGEAVPQSVEKHVQLQGMKDSMKTEKVSLSGYTVLFTLTSADNEAGTIALWDLKTQHVTYHHIDKPCVPVDTDGEDVSSLLITDDGLSMLLFGITQEELLNRLMIHGSAGTVDALCHQNHWDRCSIPIHALQAGLKNRQLDTVDFFLKSKENLFNLSTGHISEQTPESSISSLQLQSVVELRPALDLLCSAVKEKHLEAQSKQFAEQLLTLLLAFLHKQIQEILTHNQDLDENMQNCVNILTCYISELRTFMKKFPQKQTGADLRDGPENVLHKTETNHLWNKLSPEQVVSDAVLSNSIPSAQTFFRICGNPHQNLSELTHTGLKKVFECLINKDLTTASRLLKNMGFNVQEQLHRICFYTANGELRDFLVENLQNQGCLSDEEKAMVTFVHQVEQLYSVPFHGKEESPSYIGFLRMARINPKHKNVLTNLLKPCHGTVPLDFRRIVLDWVRWWDKCTQERILLDRQPKEALKFCSPSSLWRLLSSNHEWEKMLAWIKETTEVQDRTLRETQWPLLTSEIVSQDTLCNTYTRNEILDLLARKGIFIPSELEHFDKLLLRLSHTEGIMQNPHTVPKYQTKEAQDFHEQVIRYCLEHSLQQLLYCYLDFYKLTPSNCPSLNSQSLQEGNPWFEFLVRIREVSNSPTDSHMVFQASLANAQIMIPSNQASISSMLVEGRTLLALATMMYAPGGIDQVVCQNEEVCGPLWNVDPQLLKMALAPYPKLKAALFPQCAVHGIPSLDISLYHLIKSLHPFDPSRLFGWQSANTLAVGDTSNELPHFSRPDLINRYAITERLDFLYYLRHGRPSFAFGTFLVQHLAKSKSSKQQIQCAAEEAYSLGLVHFCTPSVAASCVCFLELLGVESFKLRVDLKVANIILDHLSKLNIESTFGLKQTLAEKVAKLSECEKTAAAELLVLLEEAVSDNINKQGLSRTSYKSGQEWSLVIQFCKLHGLKLSTTFLHECAEANDWLQFILFIQLSNYQADEVNALLEEFNPPLKDHLLLAFNNLQIISCREMDGYQSNTESIKIEKMHITKNPTDLFQILLCCQDKSPPWHYLTSEAVRQQAPILTILAACLRDANILHCLCVWIITHLDTITVEEATNHIKDSLEHHEFDLHDFTMIWKLLLKKQNSKVLIRSFQLFQKDSPLLHLLHMYEMCQENKNYSEAKNRLQEFHMCLTSLKTAPKPSCEIPVAWLQSQATALLLLMLQQCQTQYELRKLLQLFADIDNILISSGPNFKKLSALSQILQDTAVPINPDILCNYSLENLQKECNEILKQLLEKHLFILARQVAKLAELPVDSLVIHELLQELSVLKNRGQWCRKEAREHFWRKCHEAFICNSVTHGSAYEFFLNQASTIALKEPVVESSDEEEIDNIQEKYFLLTIAGHWVAQKDAVPIDQLEAVEKEIWLCRIAQHIALNNCLYRYSRQFSADGTSFEDAATEFAFNKLCALNTSKYLKLEGLPNKETADCRLNRVQTEALNLLVGHLLDEGCIHESSRVCRYFNFYSRDVALVLHCRALASGDADATQFHPDIQIIIAGRLSLNEGTEKEEETSSDSTQSSFVVAQNPGDKVVKHLQILTEECIHGTSYCRQVLSLYELSQKLGCTFSDISAQDPEMVLREVLSSSQPEKYKKAQAFITTQNLDSQTVADLIAGEVVQALLSSSGVKGTNQKQIYSSADGKEEFRKLAKLCQDPSVVGAKLLDRICSVPSGELACTVELLILAHDCFTATCHMEGIARVLDAARHLSHDHLTPNEEYSLMVRLLTGIGRYNDMTYIFDLLHQNHRFEMLLRKNVESNGHLKMALLDYIKRCHPGDSEKHNMVALCFSMRREIGENHEVAARTQLKLIESQTCDEPINEVPGIQNSLTKVLTLLKDAAESYSKDSCVRQALRCVKLAKLITLQLYFLNNNQNIRLINLQRHDLVNRIISLPRFYQVSVVADAYDYIPDWAEVLYQQVVIRGDFAYLDEFKQQRLLTPSLFEEISKKFKQSNTDATSSQNLKKLLKYCEDVYIYYKLAYEHNFFDIANKLLQDTRTSCYLNDMHSS